MYAQPVSPIPFIDQEEMASNNLMSAEQPWSFHTAFPDAFISDIFTRETDVLTKALQKSFGTEESSDAFSEIMAEPIFANPHIQTPTASDGSEKEASLSVPKQRRVAGAPQSGRVSKRKPRTTSKRTSTTFVAVDPENFRQMVQQVTGVKFGGVYGQPEVVKPEPHRAVRGVHQSSVLDTSSFFLDGFGSSLVAQPPPSFTAVADTSAPVYGGFDSFCSFPTLESYVVRE